MRRPGPLLMLLAIVLCLAALTARAAHTQATLVLSDDTAKPGDTVWVGVDLKMDPGWHTYWKNPGEAGMATTIAWQLPPGVTAGDIQWPLPEKLPPIEVTTYGYNGEVMLLVPLKIGTNVPPGPITLTANLTWLECKDVCIPAKTTVQATLNIGSEIKLSANAAAIESWKGKVPQTNHIGDLSVWWEKPSTNDTRSLIFANIPMHPHEGMNGLTPANVNPTDFFPDAYDNFEVQALTVQKSNNPSPDMFWFRKEVKKFSGDWPKEISGVIVIWGSKAGFDVTVPIEDESPYLTSLGETNSTSASISTPVSQAAVTPSASPSLALMLLYAFIGGLILNVMPCVLPVIALKILGFVSEARSEPRRVRNLGFIYALGVLVSFAALAAIFIGIKAAGNHIGWGMQFSSPVFVVCMTTLITLVALNLFGVFEVLPGGRVMDAAGDLASRHGAAGAFFNGFLATVLATPCTAAFMATALAFAFSQSATIIALIMLFLGLGLAAPYVVLSCNPALLKFLPKPGQWMEKFKIAMGFPMLATVIWLLGIALADFGERVIWLAAFLVILAFTAWIFGEFVQRGRKAKGIAIVIVILLLAANYTYALRGGLFKTESFKWEPWTPTAVAEARAAGKPVLVDFTATWCVPCNYTVKPALEQLLIVARLEKMNAVALLGDYSQSPQPMTEAIAKYGGAGVPMVVVFPKNPNAQPIVLRQPAPFEFPSSYARAVLTALDQAEKK